MKIIANEHSANDIFKFIRQNAGITQTEFGNSINRKKRVITYYESGNRNYNFSLLLKIANLCNLNIIIKDKYKKFNIQVNNYKANEIFKLIRTYSKLNPKEFGKIINKTERTIYYYESGDRDFNFDVLLNLIKKFGLILIIEDNKN